MHSDRDRMRDLIINADKNAAVPPAEDLVSHRVWILHCADPKKWWLAQPAEFQLAARPRNMEWKPGAKEWADPVEPLPDRHPAYLISYEDTYPSERAALETLRDLLSKLYTEVDQRIGEVADALDRLRAGAPTAAATEKENAA